MVFLFCSESTAATMNLLSVTFCMHVAARCSGTRSSNLTLSILRIPDKSSTKTAGLSLIVTTVKSSTAESRISSCICGVSLSSALELSTKSSESSKRSTFDSPSA